MTETPISIFQKAVDLGLKLAFKPPDTLVVEASKPWPKEFAELLRDFKPQLLALLQLPFVMADSPALGETILLCQDEEIKEALVEAGASEWSVYTRDELRILEAQNRVAPLTDAELRKLHDIKQTFGARIAE